MVSQAEMVLPCGESPIATRARRFHERQPAVMEDLIQLCRRWLARGQNAWSINGAFEVLRWQRRVAGLPDDHEEYKLNNSYRAWYAREIMRRHPELDGLFSLREQRL